MARAGRFPCHKRALSSQQLNSILSTQKPLNPWNYKPWWCQPWSILLTGLAIVFGSWALTRSVWLTGLVGLPILVWWTYFLWLWPHLIRQSSHLTDMQATSASPLGEETNPPAGGS